MTQFALGAVQLINEEISGLESVIPQEPEGRAVNIIGGALGFYFDVASRLAAYLGGRSGCGYSKLGIWVRDALSG
ncbi:MAG: hypothetical protein M3Y27_19225, partial [Acidobacteriota bacterium]|nr:hypothetical protein [Acidobacteriota bacterium]